MAVEFFETEAPVQHSDIEAVENRVGLRFPDEYRNHLLKYNGGRCHPNIFTFAGNGIDDASDVAWFLAIYDGKYDNLNQYIDILKIEEKRMPSHMVPIAHDSTGNFICISCGDSDFGRIFFWDHELEVDYGVESDENYSNLFPLAHSLSEFLDNLITLEESESSEPE